MRGTIAAIASGYKDVVTFLVLLAIPWTSGGEEQLWGAFGDASR